MIEPSLQIGGGNWANKSDSLLGYHKDGANFYADELTFSRNSEGSYTDANGLIQSMPYNLATYSEQFDNASWTKSGSSVVSGFTSPKGDLSAFKLVESTSLGTHWIRETITVVNGKITFSIFAKKGERDYILLRENTRGGYYFNLNNGTIGSVYSTAPDSYEIKEFSNGWYKCSITVTTSNSTGDFLVYTANANNSNNYQGDGTSGIYIYGAQLNQGSTALPYFATTTRLNLARVDYKDNVNGSLLLEPQRTNLVTYSSEFSNAAWSKISTTVTANNTTSPDGTTNADKIIVTSSTGQHYISRPAYVSTPSNSSPHIISIFVKAAEFSKVAIRESRNSGSYCCYNLLTGVLIEQSATTSTIENYGNGWFKINLPYTTLSFGQSLPQVFVLDDNYVSGNPNSYSYTGNGTSGIYIWGAQLELGSYPTSYIKSEGAATTRLADTCSKTGISDVIGQTEGTMFFYADIQKFNDSSFYIGISNGYSLGSAIYLYQPSNGNLSVANRNSGNDNYLTVTNANWSSGFNKVAIVYTTTSLKLFINGVQKGSISFSGLAPFTNFTLGSRTDQAGVLVPKVGYKQVELYATALTDSEAIALTSL